MTNYKKRFLVIFILVLTFIFSYSMAVWADEPPTKGLPTNLGQLIQQIFGWALSVLGIAVFVMFFYSGFLWLTAAGNTSKIGEAKTHMTNAVFGAVLLLSSYLILYTINPDFVKNTVNLPGLGSSESDNGSGASPPADALDKHPDQSALVKEVKSQLESEGSTFATDCEVFEIAKHVAWQLKDDGAGLFKKSAGEGICEGYSVKRIVYPDGYLFKILTDSGAGGTNGPEWAPEGCGTAASNGTCPDSYAPAIEPGQTTTP